MKQNVVVFFGGKSCEHDISILTAMQTIKSLNAQKYNIFPIYISDENRFFYGKNLDDIEFYKTKSMSKFNEVFLQFGTSNINILIKNKLKSLCKCDCAIVCCHGKGGEDGCLSGALELCDFAYVCPQVLASSLFMSKSATKLVAKDIANVVEYFSFCFDDYCNKKDALIEKIEQILNYPVIVKPDHLGSSIGICRANNKEELLSAIGTAFSYDDSIIVEKCLTNFTELNVSVTSFSSEILASEIEQPILSSDILSFADKYLTNNNKSSMANQKRIFPAEIEESTKEKLQNISKILYKKYIDKGIIRIDYLLDENGKIFLNEVNTVPGSLSYYLWSSYYDFATLLDNLIAKSQKVFQNKSRFINKFKSNGIFNYNGKK